VCLRRVRNRTEVTAPTYIIHFALWYYPADFQNVVELKKMTIFDALIVQRKMFLEEMIGNSSI
jgi:hypothetical protein